MKRVLVAGLAFLSLAGTAAAADLPIAPAYPVKAPIYAPAYSWTGFYIGVNGGGGFGTSSWTTTGNFNTSGGVFGGTLGYNYQFGQGVIGIEGDGDWANIRGTTTTACPLGCRTSDTWMATIRGRLGYAADRFMPYVTGGAAFGDIRAATPGFAGVSNTNAGWTIGGGLEFAVAPRWTLKAEYLYVDLGNTACGLACGAAATNNVAFRTNLVRGGVNFHF